MFASSLPEEFNFNLDLQPSTNNDVVVPPIQHHQGRRSFQSWQHIHAYSTRGDRSRNLDQFDVKQEKDFVLVGLYDGHGQPDVSFYLKNHLCDRIVQHPRFIQAPAFVMQECLNQIEEQVCAMEGQNSGSTVVLALLLPKQIIVVNVGDSVGIGVKNGENTTLTKAHNLEEPEERENIMRKGGCILKCGDCYRLNGKLNLSRSIGDKSYKPLISHTPDVHLYDGDFHSIILASDGCFTGKRHRSIIEIQNDLMNHKNFRDNATLIKISNPFL